MGSRNVHKASAERGKIFIFSCLAMLRPVHTKLTSIWTKVWLYLPISSVENSPAKTFENVCRVTCLRNFKSQSKSSICLSLLFVPHFWSNYDGPRKRNVLLLKFNLFEYSSYLFPKVFLCQISWNLIEWFSRNSAASPAASVQRSFYLLNARIIFAIFLHNWTQCIDSFSILFTKVC